MSLPKATQDLTFGCGSTTEPGSGAIFPHLDGDIGKENRRRLETAIHSIKRHPRL